MKHRWSVTLFLTALFLCAQLLGLVIINSYIDKEKTAAAGETVFEELPLALERPEIEERTSFIYIFIAVLIGTGILLLLLRFNLARLWKAWYALAVFVTLTIAFAAFIPQLYAALLSLVATVGKIFRPNVLVQNASELFMYGGLAAIFVPVMSVFAAGMLLLLIALYDMYAVWKSRHMITLAKFQSKSNIFAGFAIPYRRAPVRQHSGKASLGKKPGLAILGGGDIAFPLLFTGAVFRQLGVASVVISVTAALALLLLLIFSKKGRFYPAMLFLSAGCLLGYGLLMLLRMALL